MIILWKHKDNRDVAFEVIKSFRPKGKDYINLKVAWWNIGECHEPWPMIITQTIKKYPLEKWQKEWSIYRRLPY